MIENNMSGGPSRPQQNGDVVGHASRMVSEARALGRSIGQAGEKINTSIDLAGRVERNPIGMCLAALGVGYVLGGGLFSPLTGKLVKVGVRLALIPLVKGQIAGLAGGISSKEGSF